MNTILSNDGGFFLRYGQAGFQEIGNGLLFSGFGLSRTNNPFVINVLRVLDELNKVSSQ